MVFPSDFDAILNDRNFTDPNKQKYIDVRMLSTKGETDQGNLESWNVTSVEQNWIKIDLKFDKPQLVAQGENEDILVVTLQFNNITDIYRQQLPDCVIKMKNIPPQLEDASATKKVASFSQGIVSAVMVVSLVVSPAVSRSLSPVWSLLNSL